MAINKEKLGEPLGVGGEKEVYQDPNNPDRVIGIFREGIEQTPNQIKARFYLTKILHLLFPKNIPDMHWAGSKPNAFQADKGEHDERHAAMRDYQFAIEDNKYLNMSAKDRKELIQKEEQAYMEHSKDPDVGNFVDRLDELGIRGKDLASVNFSKDSEGNILYLDTFYVWRKRYNGTLQLFCDFDKLENSFNQLSEQDRVRAKSYLDRLREIYEEEKKLTKFD